MTKKKRKCSRCSQETDELYSDDEWQERDEICELCEDEELLVLGII
jgi:hypothetical protein